MDTLREASRLESEFYVQSQRYKTAGRIARESLQREERTTAITDRFRHAKTIDLLLDDFNLIRRLDGLLEAPTEPPT